MMPVYWRIIPRVIHRSWGRKGPRGTAHIPIGYRSPFTRRLRFSPLRLGFGLQLRQDCLLSMLLSRPAIPGAPTAEKSMPAPRQIPGLLVEPTVQQHECVDRLDGNIGDGLGPAGERPATGSRCPWARHEHIELAGVNAAQPAPRVILCR
jgi:hypothetical protein